MSKVTTLAEGQITPTDQLVIELVQADEAPAVVIVTRPGQGDRVASATVRRDC